MDKLMTLDEFCEITDQKKKTVYQNKYLGKYPFKIISTMRKLKFRKVDVEKWINDGCPYNEPERK